MGGKGPPRLKTIALFTDDPDRGGVAQYNHSILLGLAARGWRVVCIQPRSDGCLTQEQARAGVEHRWLPYDPATDFTRPLTDMATPRKLFGELRPDLILFSDCCPVSNLAARHAALALKVPFVCVVGFVGEYLLRDAAPYLSVIARHYAAARRVVAVSEENLVLLKDRFGSPEHNSLVIHYGRPPAYFVPPDRARRDRLRAALGIPLHAVVGLTAARFARIKGYHHQLAALERLERTEAFRDAYFVWLGDGEDRPAIEAEIRRRRWQDRIKTPGFQWNMPDWYDAADFFVLTSEVEGMPLAIMEAMAKGLPVAASAVSGIPEELGGTGCLLPDPKRTPRETATTLAVALEGWLLDPAARIKAGHACRARAVGHFREEMMVARTLEVLAAA